MQRPMNLPNPEEIFRDRNFSANAPKMSEEENKEFTMYNCDVFLEKDKPAFLEFIKGKAGKEYKTFPMVFLHGVFIGGFTDTYKILLKEEDSEPPKYSYFELR